MKKLLFLLSFLSFGPVLPAQNSAGHLGSDSLPVASATQPVPSTPDTLIPRNRYGDLMDDDTLYNFRYHWLTPSSRIVMANVTNWALARYIYKFDWARVGPEDWKNNFKKGPEWDADGFGINFIGHPHTGNFYFNIARSNGYSFWSSLPFAIQGSAVWEYFGENTRPSYNDLINTPISGLFLGEVFYRLSSNILDDRTTGSNRFWREFLAGVINPPRFMNRLTQGKLRRVTPREVYQKEPLNTTLSAGIHKVNDKLGKDNRFGTGQTNAMLNLQLDYGDPFETRRRKPFDVFRLRVELGYGSNKRLLDHVNGYGILAGRNFKMDRLLGGLFQHYDYWDNSIFQVASLGFGGGLISRIRLSGRSNIYSNLHLALVPLAGNNTQYGPDTSEFRHYNFGGGLESKIEETMNLGAHTTIGFTGYFYWIHTYSGLPGNSLVGIFKPAITFKLFKNLRIGMEHHIYRNDRFLQENNTLHLTRTEQKLFLQYFFEDRQRTGKYH